MQYLGEIFGNLWYDVDSNGEFNSGETALVGQPITLTKVGDPSFQLVTYASSNGFYSFGSVPWGDYLVTVTPPSGEWALPPSKSNPQTINISATSRPWYGVSPGAIPASEANYFNYRLPRTQISGSLSSDNGTKLGGWIVYLDINNSGTLDGDEARTVTDNLGSYTFSGLEPDTTYTVNFIPTSNKWSTGSQTVTTIANAVVQSDFQLTFSGSDNTDILPGSISGVVWNDIDHDGVQDEYDPTNPFSFGASYGLAGWQVDLYTATDEYLQSTQTDLFGRYTFNQLPAGDYRLQLNVTASYTNVPFAVTDQVTGFTNWTPTVFNSNVNLSQNEILTDINFGLLPVFSTPLSEAGVFEVFNFGNISGFVWNDVDGNGVLSQNFGNEPPLGGWTVNLLQNGQIIKTVFTDQNGYYGFTDVPVSNDPYTVEVEPPDNPNNWQLTAGYSQPINIVAEEQFPINFVDFGYQSTLKGVSGFVWNDLNGNGVVDFSNPNEKGLSGWKVNLSQNNQIIANVFTNINGNFNFAVPNGDYTLTIEAPVSGWQGTTPTTFTIDENSFVFSQNIGFQGSSGSISGFLYNDANQSGQWDYFFGETALNNWTVYLDQNNNNVLDAGDISTVTDTLGGYQFNNLAGGTYNLKVNAPPGWQATFPTPAQKTFTITTSEIFTVENFGFFQGAIVNRPPLLVNPIWGRAVGEDIIIPGVFVDPDGNPLTGTATRGDGTPLPSWLNISVLANGDVSLDFNNAPTTFTPFFVKVTASDGEFSVDNFFRLFPISSGFVIDNYIAGATVFFDADQDGILDANEPFTTTDADGFYQLDIPDSSNYHRG